MDSRSNITHVLPAFRRGIQDLIKYWRIWLLVFGCNLGFALIVALPLKYVLDDTIGARLISMQEATGFDYTLITEILRTSGDRLSVILDQSLIIALLYLLFSIFLTGGILAVYRNRPEKLMFNVFWTGALQYFWRLFRLTLYFCAVQALLFFIFIMVFQFFGINVLKLESDYELVQRARVLLPIYLALALFIGMVHDYIKIRIVDMDPRFLNRPIMSTIGLVRKNLIPALVLYLINLLIVSIFLFLYYLIKSEVEIGSASIILLIGETMLIIRIGTKLLNLASATELYRRWV